MIEQIGAVKCRNSVRLLRLAETLWQQATEFKFSAPTLGAVLKKNHIILDLPKVFSSDHSLEVEFISLVLDLTLTDIKTTAIKKITHLLVQLLVLTLN